MVKNTGIELISIHIPKTGGRSFRTILETIYGKGINSKDYDPVQFPEGRFSILRPENFPGHIRAVHAHIPVEQCRPLIEKYNPRVVTWLRDPVERVISNYYFFMQRIRQGGANKKQMQKRNYTVLEYAAEGRKTDRMAFFLKGMPLEEFYFIGLLERFEEDMDQLAVKMGWPLSKPYPFENRNVDFKKNNDCATQYDEIDDTLREKIAEINPEDIKLYNEVKAMRGIS